MKRAANIKANQKFNLYICIEILSPIAVIVDCGLVCLTSSPLCSTLPYNPANVAIIVYSPGTSGVNIFLNMLEHVCWMEHQPSPHSEKNN